VRCERSVGTPATQRKLQPAWSTTGVLMRMDATEHDAIK
jgi:hypothetical protein